MDKIQDKLFDLLLSVSERVADEFEGQTFEENDAVDIVSENKDFIIDCIWDELKFMNTSAQELFEYLKNHFSIDDIERLLSYECDNDDMCAYLLDCFKSGTIEENQDVKMVLLSMLGRTLIDNTFEDPSFLQDVENNVIDQISRNDY